MMFVTKIAAPLPSNTAALLLTSPERMRMSRRTADNVLSVVIAASSTQDAYLPSRVDLVSRSGFSPISTTTSSSSRAISGQRGTTV